MKTFLTEPSTERERSVDAINGRDDGGGGGREVVDGARTSAALEVRGMSSGVVSRRRETVVPNKSRPWLTHWFVIE